MCNAVGWTNHLIRFSDPDAMLPVVSRSGRIVSVPWGVPYSEPGQPMPKGACARLESVKEGRWRRWHPRPVRILVEKFSERSHVDRCNYWFSLPADLAIQGLFIPPSQDAQYGRVYVVTVSLEVARQYGLQALFPLPSGGIADVHDRWPRLIPRGDADLELLQQYPFPTIEPSV